MSNFIVEIGDKFENRIWYRLYVAEEEAQELVKEFADEDTYVDVRTPDSIEQVRAELREDA